MSLPCFYYPSPITAISNGVSLPTGVSFTTKRYFHSCLLPEVNMLMSSFGLDLLYTKPLIIKK